MPIIVFLTLRDALTQRALDCQCRKAKARTAKDVNGWDLKQQKIDAAMRWLDAQTLDPIAVAPPIADVLKAHFPGVTR